MTLVIFDCDGVLVDSEHIACQVLAEMICGLGHPITLEETIRRFCGRSLADTRALSRDLLGRVIPDDIVDHHRGRLFERLRTELRPIAGVEAAIAAIPHRRCVASSSPRDRLALSLKLAGLTRLFGDDLFSAADVSRGKPAPDLFLHAAARMEVEPGMCIVIEDSPLGIEAARAAGMRVIGFVGGSHATYELAGRLAAAQADIVIRTMSDLPASVRRIAGRGPVRMPA